MSHDTLSRRTFLGTTTAGLALAAGGVFGAGPRSSEGATLRWGIIGTGTRGTFTHIPVLKEAPESEVVALCDVSDERLQTAVGKVARPVAAYADYQKLLANPDVNAVVIATPNLFHREMFLAVLQAGKHVLCEKPAGVGPADAAAMKAAADSAKTVVMFGMQYRNNPRQRQIKALIDEGRIGRPKYLVQNAWRGDWNMNPNVWQYADPKLAGGKARNWRLSHAATGGTLNEFSCHYLDLLHWMVGAVPQRVSATGGVAAYPDGRDTWDYAHVTLSYPGGVTAVHTLCMFGPGRNDLAVMGDEGSIETKGDVLTVTARRGQGRGGARTQEIKPERQERRSADAATLGLFEDFLACVKTGKKPEASADRAVAASRTCWLAELASNRKAEVKWDDLA